MMQPQDMMQQSATNYAPQLLTPQAFSKKNGNRHAISVRDKQAEWNRLSDMIDPEEGEIRTTPTTHAALNSSYNELYTRLQSGPGQSSAATEEGIKRGEPRRRRNGAFSSSSSSSSGSSKVEDPMAQRAQGSYSTNLLCQQN